MYAVLMSAMSVGSIPGVALGAISGCVGGLVGYPSTLNGPL